MNKLKIVILGSHGQLGSQLKSYLSKFDQFVIYPFSKSQLNVSDFDKVNIAITNIKPDILINSSAYTNVEEAENSKNLSFLINSEAVRNLAKLSKNLNFFFIHFSTDYVFDGKKRSAYNEFDKPNPLNIYGLSKLEGEKFIKNLSHNYIIFRTSWIIGVHEKNFIKKLINLAMTKEKINVVVDQIGVPTSTNLISKVTKDCIESYYQKTPWESGIYNLCPKGSTNWYEMADLIIKKIRNKNLTTKIKLKSLNPVKSNEYITLAKRPLNSKLDNLKISKMLSFDIPFWNDDFNTIVEEIIDLNI